VIYDIDDLIVLIEEWAEARNLILGATPKGQFHKLIQECAELSDNLCKGKDPRDDIGDILVVLIIMAKQLNVDIADCLNIAYDDIKDRRGRMVDGIFIKESDL
jgi:NTP pyrophosphatase (non-canonical NTP hydrolase)